MSDVQLKSMLKYHSEHAAYGGASREFHELSVGAITDALDELEESRAAVRLAAQARAEAIEECACKLEDMYGNTSIAAFVRDLLKDET